MSPLPMNLRLLRVTLGCLALMLLNPPLPAATPPGVLILDDGGEASEACRGWPVHLSWFALTEPAGETLVIRSLDGPEISVNALADGEWWLSPEQTLALPPGPAIARAGTEELELRFVDPPDPLPPVREEARRQARLDYALATGRTAIALSEAEAWVAAHPSLPHPRAKLGEVLAAQGRWSEASTAFEAGLDRVAWTDHPPESMLSAAGDARWQLLLTLPTQPVAPPEPPEPTTLAEQDRVYGADANGQWAATATASSSYRATGDYSAARAVGAPDVSRYADSPLAWASQLADAGPEWLEVTFNNAVVARAVRIRQVFNPGAITNVTVYDMAGAATTVFSGTDTNAYPPGQIAWFVAKFTRTASPVQRVRITLDSARVKGWNEIDCVQLVAAPVAPPRLEYRLNAAAGTLEITSWPTGFVLQQATRLDPADWQTHATQPPVSIPTTGAPAFFRLIQSP